MPTVDAIILAGAPAGVELSPEDSGLSRAMIRLGDKTMLQWVVDALRASESVGKMIAVGRVSAEGLDSVLEPGDDLVGNIRLGMEALDSADNVLVVCSDIPLLTSEGVDDFVTRAVGLKVDMAYPILPKSHCEKRYPKLRRTYLKTGDGVFTGGNMVLMSRGFVENHWQAIADAYAARKHVSRLARMIGLGVLARVIVGQMIPSVLKLSVLERAASRMLEAKVKAVVSAHPELGEDVDKPSDLEVVRRILASSTEV